MKIAILGYGSQGQSALEYWSNPANQLTICDLNEKLEAPADVTLQLGPDYLAGLDQYDLLVRTPIIHPREIVAANLGVPDILAKVTSNTNEFFRVCPSANIIGVTGTKGKGTTSTLIAKMLEATGKRVHLGGNIGIPPLKLLKADIQPEDWVVLELANFQLIDLKHSPHIAVCLLVEPEHMDWHEDFEEYVATKQQLFINQTEDDLAIYYANNPNSQSVADASLGIQIPYMAAPGALIDKDIVTIDGQDICKVQDLQLLGKHNWQNVCAAVTAVWQVTQDVAALRGVLQDFSGLPYRLELRREVAGVRYYNDSYASQPEATIAALHAIEGPKVMIVGGFERGLDLSKLVKAFQEQAAEVRKVVVIGASGDRVVENLEKAGFQNYLRRPAKTMEEVVNTARAEAQAGDAVVLSPGFASFDMFKNFEDRGQQFNALVSQL